MVALAGIAGLLSTASVAPRSVRAVFRAVTCSGLSRLLLSENRSNSDSRESTEICSDVEESIPTSPAESGISLILFGTACPECLRRAELSRSVQESLEVTLLGGPSVSLSFGDSPALGRVARFALSDVLVRSLGSSIASTAGSASSLFPWNPNSGVNTAGITGCTIFAVPTARAARWFRKLAMPPPFLGRPGGAPNSNRGCHALSTRRPRPACALLSTIALQAH